MSNEKVEGEIVREFEVDKQDSDFARATLNHIQARNLEGGKYLLVKVD